MRLLVFSLWKHCLMVWMVLLAPLDKDRSFWKGLVLWLIMPFYLALQIFHGLCWLIDEILFRDYRKVTIEEPLFVIGPPRSGTTHLHRSLALDERRSTFSTWEAIFAPTITGRYLVLGLAKTDSLLGSPIKKIVSRVTGSLAGGLDAIHELRLSEPEEDFLVLLPVAACFLMALPFPDANWYWRIARMDEAVSPSLRKSLLRYYRACIQKHLFVFGARKRFLSKNASYCGWVESLLQEFPDAKILVPLRNPVNVVASQLSAINPALTMFGYREFPENLRDQFVELLAYYYSHLYATSKHHSARMVLLDENLLRKHFFETMCHAFSELEIAVDDPLLSRLTEIDRQSKNFQSGHVYCLEDFGLSDAVIRKKFSYPFGALKID